jgi:hypothetical protein
MYKILLPLALLAAPTLAAADGYEGSTKDSGYAYSYSVKQQRGSWTCPPEFSRKECSRIRQEVARRRAREDRPRKVVVERRIPVYRDTGSQPVRAQFGGKRCIGRVTVTGAQRPTEGLARGAAWKEWRSVVRATAGGGEQFMDDRYAVGERVRCHITGSGRFLKRCEVSAVPCR